ncbi:UNVERIFIED_CONTAM: hypothetical protein Slati_4207500 [Sesamum latifolium]|uniref:Uncharacterized protein n=1 Tax=Sesamum latifolium TaxID=2727402 RepID=A0AAW2TDR3_9LAMI
MLEEGGPLRLAERRPKACLSAAMTKPSTIFRNGTGLAPRAPCTMANAMVRL